MLISYKSIIKISTTPVYTKPSVIVEHFNHENYSNNNLDNAKIFYLKSKH